MNSAVKAIGENYFHTRVFPINVSRVCYEEGVTHPHDLTSDLHYHDFTEIVFILKGQGVHEVEGKHYRVSAGDIFVLQDYQKHRFVDAMGVEIVNVMYDLKNRSGMLNLQQIKKIPGYHALFILEPSYRNRYQFNNRLKLDRSAMAKVEFILNSLFWELKHQEEGYEEILRNLLENLIITLSRFYSKIDTHEALSLMKIGKALDYMEKRYDQHITLGKLSEIAYMSNRHFHRTFKNATGEAPINYLIQIRLQNARRLLRRTDKPVSDIAFSVGFTDPNYFTKKFKSSTGMTPVSYRRSFN